MYLADIERMALEMAHVAFKESIEVNTPWTDWAGRKTRQVHWSTGRYACHAPGSCSFKWLSDLPRTAYGASHVGCCGLTRKPLGEAPFPRHIPPPIKPAKDMAPNTPLKSPPLGFPTAPEDLVIDDDGNHSASTRLTLGKRQFLASGMMHMVINNAAKGDPYEIDTLMLFMANMAWNSSMNTKETQDLLRLKGDNGEYKIPFIVTSDAFHSEMVSFSDLVLPDTTYLERFDTISMLDRPISEPHSACDSIRQPIIEPDRDVRPFQEVLIEYRHSLGVSGANLR